MVHEWPDTGQVCSVSLSSLSDNLGLHCHKALVQLSSSALPEACGGKWGLQDPACYVVSPDKV
jgi:hypothetical protein